MTGGLVGLMIGGTALSFVSFAWLPDAPHSLCAVLWDWFEIYRNLDDGRCAGTSAFRRDPFELIVGLGHPVKVKRRTSSLSCSAVLASA